MKKIIQYEGFEPSPQLKSAVKQVLAHMGEKSPVDSSQLARIQKVGDQYLGEIKISTPTGGFSARGENQSFDLLLEDLTHKMDQDLSEWKKHRFSLA